MRIGVDVDGPVYDLLGALRTWLANHGHDPALMVEPTVYDFGEQWGLAPGRLKVEFDKAARSGFLFRHGDPEPGAGYAITDLLDAGHQVYLVTQRPRWAGEVNLVVATKLWLNEHAIPCTGLKFSTDKTRFRTDLFIDDHLDNYRALTAAGRRCYLLDRSYNQTPDETLPRVSSLVEFTRMVLGESSLLAMEGNLTGLWHHSELVYALIWLVELTVRALAWALTWAIVISVGVCVFIWRLTERLVLFAVGDRRHADDTPVQDELTFYSTRR